MNKHVKLFDRIAKIYGFFFNFQTKRYRRFVKIIDESLKCHKVLDLGFGTGALLKVLHESNKTLSGMDGSLKMVNIASKKVPEIKDKLQVGDITDPLPYETDSFDCVISSYVVHGLNASQRQDYYKEARRVAKHHVILYEHSKNPNGLIKIAEYFEGGEFFRFRDVVDQELESSFKTVETIRLNKNVTIYILDV